MNFWFDAIPTPMGIYWPFHAKNPGLTTKFLHTKNSQHHKTKHHMECCSLWTACLSNANTFYFFHKYDGTPSTQHLLTDYFCMVICIKYLRLRMSVLAIEWVMKASRVCSLWSGRECLPSFESLYAGKVMIDIRSWGIQSSTGERWILSLFVGWRNVCVTVSSTIWVLTQCDTCGWWGGKMETLSMSFLKKQITSNIHIMKLSP